MLTEQRHHMTTTHSNEWSRATMLRQVALARDFGDTVATAVEILTCDDCDWRETAHTHEEALTKRLLHEKTPLLDCRCSPACCTNCGFKSTTAIDQVPLCEVCAKEF